MKKNTIPLFWYRHKKGKGNFGDELNPYIVGKLSGSQIEHVNANYIFDDKWLAIKTITKALFRNKLKIFDYLHYFYMNVFSKHKTLFAIGSILHNNYSKKNIIWGSGIINSKENFVESDFKAVRGFHTINRIKELGYEVPTVVGDPALLLPLINPKINPKKENKIAIIPHYQHYNFLKQKLSEEVKIIDLLDSIENILHDINASELVLSTSLHGIIVSHAYQIPALWVEFEELSNNKLLGDDVKFHDYLSSVKINSYEPLLINTTTNFDHVFLQKIINNYQQYLIAKSDVISSIQKGLLSVAPFPIQKEYIQ